MSDERFFLDTNILLYCYAQDEPIRHSITLQVAANTNTIISTQVLKETCNVLRKKLKLPWQDIRSAVDEIESNNELVQVKLATIHKAVVLAERYQLQWFDSIIVASAIGADCSVLFSEYLHHGLLINQLEIRNPFL
ncbi:PIN domain-containing protein [Dyadobacter bucti]|uniref:PIN domain-containing protein n=1 Tax=Dyadobacter bucti TaxID=2572203 RepID=UPI001107DC3F